MEGVMLLRTSDPAPYSRRRSIAARGHRSETRRIETHRIEMP